MTNERSTTSCGLRDGRFYKTGIVVLEPIPEGEGTGSCVKETFDTNNAVAICANCAVCKLKVRIGTPYMPPEYPTRRKP